MKMATFLCSRVSSRSMQHVFNILCAALFILLTMSTRVVNAADEVTCVQDNNCRCTTSDNSFYYDLEPMLKGVAPPFFKLDDDSNVTYFYDPCRSFSMVSTLSECTNAALCSESLDEIYLNLGIHATSEFRYTPSSVVKLKLLYHNGKTGAAQINSTVWLTCRTGGITELVHRSSTPTFYVFELFSPFACPKAVPIPPSQLSAGGIICIIFVVLVTVYFVCGSVYLFFFRYESGPKAIPHYEFWSSLPGLIKDGFLFTFSCGDSKRMQNSGPQYDQI